MRIQRNSGRSLAALCLLAALASQTTVQAADSGTSSLADASLSEEVNQQVNADVGPVNLSAGILLGGSASVGATKSTDKNFSDTTVGAEAKGDAEGEVNAKVGGKSKDKVKAKGKGEGEIGIGGDGGTAPVPEPSTWILLGALLCGSLALVLRERMNAKHA